MILAALRSLWGFLKLIPWQLYAVIALVLGFYGYGVYRHHQGYQDASRVYEQRIAAERAAYDKQVAELKAKQQDVIIKTVVEYRDRIKVEKVKGDEIIKEVPVLVQSECKLSGGMRVVHDAAALGRMPDDPQGAARAAPPVDPTTLATTVATNYASCRQNATQLVALQKIVSSLEQKP